MSRKQQPKTKPDPRSSILKPSKWRDGTSNEEKQALMNEIVSMLDWINRVTTEPGQWPLLSGEQAWFVKNTCLAGKCIVDSPAYKWLKVELAAGRLEILSRRKT